jgi:hypothetical protein
MTNTLSFVTPEMGERPIFHLGKYDADFFQHDIDMPSQINYQKLLRDQE